MLGRRLGSVWQCLLLVWRHVIGGGGGRGDVWLAGRAGCCLVIMFHGDCVTDVYICVWTWVGCATATARCFLQAYPIGTAAVHECWRLLWSRDVFAEAMLCKETHMLSFLLHSAPGPVPGSRLPFGVLEGGLRTAYLVGCLHVQNVLSCACVCACM